MSTFTFPDGAADFAASLAPVARAIGAEWKSHPQHAWGCRFVGPDGAELFVRADGARLRISGTYPLNFVPRERAVITVARTRPTDQIARDVVRRLLPDYLPGLRDALASKAQYDARKGEETALAAELGSIVSVADVRRTGGRGEPCGVYAHVDSQSMHVRVDGPDAVRVELSCSAETARRVLRAVVHLAGERALRPCYGPDDDGESEAVANLLEDSE